MFSLPAICLTAMIGTAPISCGDTANLNNSLNQLKGINSIKVEQFNYGNKDSLKDKLSSLGIKFDNKNNCIIVSPPGCNKPGTGNPDINKPGTDKPETDKPDNGVTDKSYAQQVADLVNAERAKAGLSALTVKMDVKEAATLRAKEIQSSFSHTRPNGKSFSSALTEKGVSFKGSGENIAYGQKTPEAVMKAWMNSDGHRANILNKNFKYIGVGYEKNASGTAYWTQLFTY